MNALDLIVLGRRLTKIGETVLRGGAQPALPTGVGLVLRDVLAHPASSIRDITERTGLRQSYVSESVAKLRDRGIVETTADPNDARRTLASVTAGHPRNVAHLGTASVDTALAQAVGASDPAVVASIIEVLEALAAQLQTGEPGPLLSQLRPSEEESS